MRKLLIGVAFAALVLSVPGVASAATDQKGAADEIEKIAKAHQLDTKVVECVKAAAENNDSERCVKAPSPILPAGNELLWGGISFLLLLIVLGKFGVPAAKSMMTARTEKIRASIDDAEKAKTDAEGVLAEYQRQLADARLESSRIIEEARGAAEQVRRDLVARAEAEATQLRQRNAEQVAGERDRVMGELQGQVAKLAIELAEKVVEHNLDEAANTRLIENYIASVGTR